MMKGDFGMRSLELQGHTLSHGEVRPGTQGRNLQSGTEAEAVKAHCLLTCSDCFLIAPKTTSRVGTTHSDLGPPPKQIINEKNGV